MKKLGLQSRGTTGASGGMNRDVPENISKEDWGTKISSHSNGEAASMKLEYVMKKQAEKPRVDVLVLYKPMIPLPQCQGELP